jgi:hypothetical protein
MASGGHNNGSHSRFLFLKKQGHIDSGEEVQALLEHYGPVADKKKAVTKLGRERIRSLGIG